MRHFSMRPIENALDGATHGIPSLRSGQLLHGDVTNEIINAMYSVHDSLGSGFLESVYARALAVDLRARGLHVERNVPFEVVYRGVPVGRYVADLIVERKVVVETKVTKTIDATHRAQILNYLRASGLEVGLVLNFGISAQFKRVVSTSPRGQASDAVPVEKNS